MTTETFHVEYAAEADVYFRLFNDVGQVLDFSDFTFKALAGATTPYVAATERADMAGTDRSGYTAAIDLGDVNPTGAVERYVLKAYAAAVPAATDNPIAAPLPVTVQFGRLGEGDVVAQAEFSVKSTAGLELQLTAWLECRGEPIDIASVDAVATCQITLREHGSAVATVTANATAADIIDGRFEFIFETPNLVDDRQYHLKVTINENGNAHVSTHNSIVIGGN